MDIVTLSLVSTKGEEFLAQLRDYQLLKEDFATLCMLEIWAMTPRSVVNL
jgi:hypothetical protein